MGTSQPGANARVAVLFQAIETPNFDGVRKPRKPGGYQDSGADIAYVLRSQCDAIEVITPVDFPDPASDENWCFPDSEEGIQTAIKRGATHLWANTVLFASHPLQTLPLRPFLNALRIVGQPPVLAESFDDKEYTNNLLRKRGGFALPKSRTIDKSGYFSEKLSELDLSLPIVGKPIRGRGSHGVTVCYSLGQLEDHIQRLFLESPVILLEEYLEGEEITVTVVPPWPGNEEYSTLPIIRRFNHVDGVVPYSGAVAVTANSRAVPLNELAQDAEYQQASSQCKEVGRLLGLTAPIRIDMRRFRSERGSKFAMFDINMKPNITGPGRPGRENEASLVVLAAEAQGWTYSSWLATLVQMAPTLNQVRNAQSLV